MPIQRPPVKGPPSVEPVRVDGSAGRVGRKPLVALSAEPTRNVDDQAIGEVARLFDAWLTLRQATNRVASLRTVAGYRDDMARWATLLAPGGEGPAWDRLRLVDLTVENIGDALAAMSAAGLSVAARQRAMAPLRGLCSWLARQRHLPFDPLAGDELTMKARAVRLPVAYSSEELGRILAAVSVEHGDQTKVMRWPIRDQATLALLAGCGLRVSELCALAWNQIAELDTDHPSCGYGAKVAATGSSRYLL